MASDLNTLIKQAKKQGWKIEQLRGGHIAFVNPDGERYTSSRTPSDHRSHKNMLVHLRRLGFEYDRARGPRRRRRSSRSDR